MSVYFRHDLVCFEHTHTRHIQVLSDNFNMIYYCTIQFRKCFILSSLQYHIIKQRLSKHSNIFKSYGFVRLVVF